MNKTNVKTKPSTTHRHDTPNNKTHIIKFRVTETEKMELQCTAKLLHLSLSTLIRRALHNAKIERTVVVAGGGEETLTAVSTLLAQCSRVGGNLNQLARHFNSGGADPEQLRAKLLDELADLTACWQTGSTTRTTTRMTSRVTSISSASTRGMQPKMG